MCILLDHLPLLPHKPEIELQFWNTVIASYDKDLCPNEILYIPVITLFAKAGKINPVITEGSKC